jgi:hypothetical protein
MSVISHVRAVPRVVVDAGLTLARVPVTAAARATGQRGNAAWPPALAFEGFEAGVETAVGSLLRDDTLVSRGRLRHAKVAKARRADQLEVVAESHRERADETLAERREQAERRRTQARRAADDREEAIEAQAEEQARRAERDAAKKAAGAAAVKRAQDRAVDRQEAAVRAETLDHEAEALAAEKKALDAAETVAAIDDTIDGTKVAREG